MTKCNEGISSNARSQEQSTTQNSYTKYNIEVDRNVYVEHQFGSPQRGAKLLQPERFSRSANASTRET